jgi:hypothetical protein
MPDHAAVTDAGIRRTINAQFYTKSLPADLLIFSYFSPCHFDTAPGLVNTINGISRILHGTKKSGEKYLDGTVARGYR